MGQQQLLLIVLGVIIVGIAIAVGISMFRSNAVSSNRDALVNDLNNLASSAQQYWRKPTSMAGGGQSFGGFYVNSVNDTNANGSYCVSASLPSGPTGGFIKTDTSIVAGAVSCIWIIGRGSEIGFNGTDPVCVIDSVTANGSVAKILN